MLSPSRRRELGAFYTPIDVADRLVAIALDGLPGVPVVCDPACGDGVFLVAAAQALSARGLAREVVARDLVWGCDIDSDAVAATRAAIVDWSGVDPGDHLTVADGLTVGERWCGRFDAVVGNPPFLNQLERATVRRSPLPPALREVARPYTDTAWLFLVIARELVHARGRVVLVQPQSFLAARDAAPVRDAVAPSLEGLWWCEESLFDASVRVCVPVLGAPEASAPIRRWTGREMLVAAPVERSHGQWSALVPSDTPMVELRGAGEPLRDIATATAGFRDEYYGLRPHVVDEPNGDRPLLVTSGLVDVGRILWGQRPTRFAGRRFMHPRVDPSGLTGPLGRWIEQRLVPKVVVATQTKVVEAAVDTGGTWVPSTPVIAVHARPSTLWRVAAALTAPGVSAWALQRHAGAALNPDAIKLSARQLLDLPLPAGDEAWQQGAKALASGRVLDAGEAMSRAYGTGDDVFEWWQGRLPRSAQAY